MPRLSQSTVALILGLGLLVGLDGWLRVAERAGYTPPPALSRPLLREALDRRAVMETNLAAVLERQRLAEDVARAVMQERLTLREGAVRLRDVYRAAPNFPWDTVARKFPGASEEECCCRLLIGQLKSMEGPDREQARAAASRLEAELEGRSGGSPLGQSA